MSLHGKLPLAGREKISSRVRWCFRFIQHSTAYWYQVRLPFRCMQDTDNAAPEWQASGDWSSRELRRPDHSRGLFGVPPFSLIWRMPRTCNKSVRDLSLHGSWLALASTFLLIFKNKDESS